MSPDDPGQPPIFKYTPCLKSTTGCFICGEPGDCEDNVTDGPHARPCRYVCNDCFMLELLTTPLGGAHG